MSEVPLTGVHRVPPRSMELAHLRAPIPINTSTIQPPQPAVGGVKHRGFHSDARGSCWGGDTVPCRMTSVITSSRTDIKVPRGGSPVLPVKPYSHTMSRVSQAHERCPSARVLLEPHTLAT
jgi:hypothetical protein